MGKQITGFEAKEQNLQIFIARTLDQTSEDLYLKEMTEPNPDLSFE